jgi:hypothetical protein
VPKWATVKKVEYLGMSGISRRSLLGSMLALAAAPAIVRAQSIMRVAPPKIVAPEWRARMRPGEWLAVGGGHADYEGNEQFIVVDRCFGRFHYRPALGGLLLVSSADSPVYFYKPA